MKLSLHRGFDDEMRALVARNLEGRGIILHPQTTLTEVLLLLTIDFTDLTLLNLSVFI